MIGYLVTGTDLLSRGRGMSKQATVTLLRSLCASLETNYNLSARALLALARSTNLNGPNLNAPGSKGWYTLRPIYRHSAPKITVEPLSIASRKWIDPNVLE
ncbi:hypothetical protein QCA50_015238 [Cerrena zonata]|uniref:HTH HARE-type domain-containing protein n=1 Tax=Cerrena zonata TaxID=2478898 RepID=A0AAW0FL87_9APHY